MISAPEYPALQVLTKKGEKPADLLIAFFHSFTGYFAILIVLLPQVVTIGGMGKGNGVDGFYLKPLRRTERPGDGELIVYLILCIRIDHETQLPGQRNTALPEKILFRGQYSHDSAPSFR